MCRDSCWWLADTRIERRRPLSSSGSLASPALWRIMHPSDKSNICSTHLVAHTTRLAEVHRSRCRSAGIYTCRWVGMHAAYFVDGKSAAKNKSFTMQTPTYAQACYYSWIQRQQPLCCLSHWYSSHLCLPCTYNSHHRLLSAKAHNRTLEQVDSFSLASKRRDSSVCEGLYML